MKQLFIFLLFPVFSSAQFYKITLQDKIIPHPTVCDSSVDRWDASFPGFASLSQTAKDLLYWTNYSRKDPKRFWDSAVNPIIQALPELKTSYSNSLEADLLKSPALPMFSLNKTLVSMAQAHASDIGIHHLPLSHSSSDGLSFSDRFNRAHLKNCGGENIGLGDDDMLLGLVLLYIDYGLESAGHRKSLLSNIYTNIGIGVFPYGNDAEIFYVQDFACPQD